MQRLDDRKLNIPVMALFYAILGYFEDLRKAPPFFVKLMKQAIEVVEGMDYELRDLTEQVRLLKESDAGWKASALAWEARYNELNKTTKPEDTELFFAAHARKKMQRKCNDWLAAQNYSTFDNTFSLMDKVYDTLLYYFVAGERTAFITEAIQAFGAAEAFQPTNRPSMYDYVKEHWFE